MLIWYLEMRSSDRIIVCQFLLVIAWILRGEQNTKYVLCRPMYIVQLYSSWPISVFLTMSHVNISVISGQFSHSDLSSVLCPPVRHALHEQIPGSLGLVSNSPLKMENALQAMER